MIIEKPWRALAWVARLPLAWVHGAGALLGWGAYALSPRYRRHLRENAALAGIDAPTRRAAVAEAGRLSAEVPWLWFRPARRPLAPLVRWQDEALLREALDAGRGLVLLTPHLGSFEVSARAYAERHGAERPITVLYRPAHQPWLARLQAEARRHPGMDAAPASLAGVRQMVRALRRGHTLGLLPDQVPPEGQGVWAPFFGRPAYTMTLAARLVQQTGAALLLAWCERLPRGAGFVLHFRRLPQPLAGDGRALADEAAAAAINAAMEAMVREQPAQYLWGYHRYKAPRPAPAPASAQPRGAPPETLP